MKTYNYKNDRLKRIQEALDKLGADSSQDELKLQLEQELSFLMIEDWKVEDRTYEAVAEDWICSHLNMIFFVRQLRSDPVLKILNDFAIDNKQLLNIIKIGQPYKNSRTGFLKQLRSALIENEKGFKQLIQTAHHLWLKRHPEAEEYPYDDVGVVLPVRIETLFDAPTVENKNWKLLLRVIPDEVSILRDNPYVSNEEREALKMFWNSVMQPGPFSPDWLEKEEAKIAWEQLTNRIRPERAAWMFRDIVVKADAETLELELPLDMPDGPLDNRISGIPSELHVYVITKDKKRYEIGQLNPSDSFNPDEDLKLKLPQKDQEDFKQENWLASWEHACKIGLGGTFDLPDDVHPDNIEVLYVVGIGDEEPDRHFSSLIDSGELSIPRLGAPTNSVHGKETSEKTDWWKIAKSNLQAWFDSKKEKISILKTKIPPILGNIRNLEISKALRRQVVLKASISSILKNQLTGRINNFGYFPGWDNSNDTLLSNQMVQALWPAIWGYYFHDINNQGNNAFVKGAWMFENFFPEGPLMPIQIGDQPYGLLPVTSLDRWESPTPTNEETEMQISVEMEMVKSFATLRKIWAGKVADKRCIVDKSTEEFTELFGQTAYSKHFVYNSFLQDDILPFLPIGWNDEKQKTLKEFYQSTGFFLGGKPNHYHLCFGNHEHVFLPLVQPTENLYIQHKEDLQRKYSILLKEFLSGLENFKDLEQLDLETIFNRKYLINPDWRPFILHSFPDSLLIRLLLYSYQMGFELEGNINASTIIKSHREQVLNLSSLLEKKDWLIEDKFVFQIPEKELKQLERAFRATLDSAAHRIDPWITGFAWQRLKKHSNSERHNHRLAVYGWVNGPFKGIPGPNEAGLLHTPSYSQTLAALILRDKFLSSGSANLKNESGVNPWHMDISSRKVHLALEIGEEIRSGAHIYEVLGRHVENIVADHQTIKELRTHPKFSMYPRKLPNSNEVCNGKAVLDYWKNPQKLDPEFSWNLTDKQNEDFQLLWDSIDTYGDLLLAEGVIRLVNKQTDHAAEAMDSISGFSPPPQEFDFINTPPSGYLLESMVLAVLPYFDANDLSPDAHPILCAEPSVAKFIEKKLGNDWEFIVKNEDTNETIASKKLSDLDLTIFDALSLSTDFLNECICHSCEYPKAKVVPPVQIRQAHQLISVLGSRPLIEQDVNNKISPGDLVKSNLYNEIHNRYKLLLSRSSELNAEMTKALEQGADIKQFLKPLLSWGILPSDSDSQKMIISFLINNESIIDSEKLKELITEMNLVLKNRIDTAEGVNDDINQPDALGILTGKLANLASSNVKLNILGCWGSKDFKYNFQEISKNRESFDEEWLTKIAATRPNLARLEALQLEMNPAFDSWSNSPEDPWQTEVVQRNLANRKDPGKNLNFHPFKVAYGDSVAFNSEKMAIGMIDSFNESIPFPERNTMAAFGFNAPSSRAPQAILLAVPPRNRQRLNNELLLKIVEETRELAFARMARMEDIDEFHSLFPTSWLQSTGPTRFRDEAWPLFAE